MLALDISAHPSQLSQPISAVSPDHKITEDDEVDKTCLYDDDHPASHGVTSDDLYGIAERLERQKQIHLWPQLTLLLRQKEEPVQD